MARLTQQRRSASESAASHREQLTELEGLMHRGIDGVRTQKPEMVSTVRPSLVNFRDVSLATLP